MSTKLEQVHDGEAASHPPPLLELKELRKRIGPVALLRDVSLTVDRGECKFVLGPHRSGKSQLLRAAAGLTSIFGGSVLLNGQILVPTRREVQKRIGFMPKPPGKPDKGFWKKTPRAAPRAKGVFPNTTVREDLEFFSSCLRIPRRRWARLIDDVLALFDMVDAGNEVSSRLPYSGQAKLFFARVILHNPDLLLLDDPLPAFEENPAEFWGIVSELKRMGKGLIVTGSEPDGAGPQVDEIAVLYGGMIIDRGEPAEVLRRVSEAGWPPPKRMYGGFVSSATRGARRMSSPAPPEGETRDAVPASLVLPPPPEPLFLTAEREEPEVALEPPGMSPKGLDSMDGEEVEGEGRGADTGPGPGRSEV